MTKQYGKKAPQQLFDTGVHSAAEDKVVGPDEVPFFNPSLYYSIKTVEKTKKTALHKSETKPELVTGWETATVLEDVKVYEDMFKAKGSIARGKLRAAEQMDCSIDHLEQAMRILNGKKVDGIQATDLVGRFGFFNGARINRVDMAKHYGKDIGSIELATERLQAILRKVDTRAAYMEYLREMDMELNKEKQDNLSQGE